MLPLKAAKGFVRVNAKGGRYDAKGSSQALLARPRPGVATGLVRSQCGCAGAPGAMGRSRSRGAFTHRAPGRHGGLACPRPAKRGVLSHGSGRSASGTPKLLGPNRWTSILGLAPGPTLSQICHGLVAQGSRLRPRTRLWGRSRPARPRLCPRFWRWPCSAQRFGPSPASSH